MCSMKTHLDACSPPQLGQLCTLGINIKAGLQTLAASCISRLPIGMLHDRTAA